MNLFKYDFIQAKLRAIHSKSIIGDNYNKLKKITTIDRLFKELFADYISMPEKETALYNELQKRYKLKILNQINYIAEYFEYKNEFINNLILRYEIDNLKILLNSYFAKQPKITKLFELQYINSLDYELIYKSDLTKVESIKSILKDTLFNFIIQLLDDNKEHFDIENSIDKYYYDLIINSLKYLNKHEYDSLKPIIIEEMNWQNITWAFRTKIYYKKAFKNVMDSFLNHKWLISIDTLETIFNLTFLPNQAEEQLKNFPISYQRFLLNYFNKDGLFDVVSLEENLTKHLINRYALFIHIENFNMLPIISFIHLKQIEYSNIVKLIESLRYNIKPE